MHNHTEIGNWELIQCGTERIKQWVVSKTTLGLEKGARFPLSHVCVPGGPWSLNYLIRQEAQAQCHQSAACQMKIGHRADLLSQKQAGQRLESHWAVASSPQSRSSRARVLIALNYPS